MKFLQQKAFSEQTISKTRAFEWYKMFKEARECVEDEERPGRPQKKTLKKTGLKNYD